MRSLSLLLQQYKTDSRIPREILSMLGGILTPEIVESGRKQYSDSRKESIIMEAKTIGKFIAALRKANGMTQRDLADSLNVSDKTVSRWERDDGAPDLSTIPVIAEIFGVTCDELLRGERKPAGERINEPDERSVKGEKQMQRILTLSLSKFRTRSFISIGVSLVGLIAAMICNLGFNRGYIGFFVGTIFYVASLVCQAIFVNSAFLSVSDEDYVGDSISFFKNSVIHLAKMTVMITLVLLGTTIPLIIFPYDAYVGLEAVSWLLSALISGLLMWVLCAVAWYFVHASLVRKGIWALREKEEVYWHNHKLKRSCARAFSLIFAVTLIVQIAVNETWSAWRVVDGTQFHEYDSFVEFMEQDVPYAVTPSGGYVAAEPLDSIYYDEHGNVISEEEAMRDEIRVPDGTEEGKVVCEYIHRNNSVVSIKQTNDDDGLPITVWTQAEMNLARTKLSVINVGIIALYGVEVLVTVLLYRKKKNK